MTYCFCICYWHMLVAQDAMVHMSRSMSRLADAVYAAAHACEKQSLSFSPDFQRITWPLTVV